MAGAKEVRAGSAYVELLTRDSKLKQGLENAQKTLQRWGDGITTAGKALMKIGLAAQVPLEAASVLFAKTGGELNTLSQRTGVTAEKLSELRYAAERGGTTIEAVATGLKKMGANITEAGKGSGEAREALRHLGLSFDKIKDLSPDQQFRLIAHQLAKIEDPAIKAAVATEVFGKNATELLPMLADGAAGLDKMAAKARELGLVWSNEDAAAANEFGDAIEDLWAVTKGLAATIGKALVPVLKEMVATVTSAVVWTSQWVDAHRGVAQAALQVAGAVVKAGAAFVVLGAGLKIVAGVAGAVAAVLGTLGIAGTAATAAIATLGVKLFVGSELMRESLASVGRAFKELKEIAGITIGGIVDALSAGEVGLAAEIMWAGIRAAWNAGIQPLRELWQTFWSGVQRVGEQGNFAVVQGWEIFTHALGDALINAVAGLKDIWSNFWAWLKNGWEDVKAVVDKAAIDGMSTMTPAQKAEAQRNVDKERDANKKGITEQRDASLAGNKADRDAKLKASSDAHTAELSRLESEHDGALRRIQDQGAAASKADRDNLERLKKELAALRTAAKVKEAFGFLSGNDKGGGGTTKRLNELLEMFTSGKVAGGVADLGQKVSARGTFNPAAIQSLQGGGVMDRVAKATEATAKHTKEIAKKPDRIFQ